MATIFTDGKFRGETDAGLPLVGGLLDTWVAGTTSAKTTYTSNSLVSPNTNPIVLNARGEADVWWGTGSIRMRLRTAAGVTIWDVDNIPVQEAGGAAANVLADLINRSDPTKGPGLVGSNTELDYPDLTVGQRIHRDYINVGDIGGTDPTGSTDNTAKVQAALATGKLVRLDGFYRVNGSVINLTTQGIVGDGSLKSGLRVATAGHALTIQPGAGYGRRALRLENFSIDSVANVCDGHYAIYAPGVGNGAAAIYNSGLNIAGLDIGTGGRMGGGFYLKDVFRVNVEDIGLNAVSWMIRVIGSVVQAKFRNVTANNDSPGSTLSAYGVSTESAVYASGTLVCENVHFIDCSYILGSRGISHQAGRDVGFKNFDSETSDYGAILNASCTMDGGIILPSPAANAFVGVFRGVNIATPDEGTDILGVEVQMSRVPVTPGSSYAFDIGDGVSPVYGLVMERCKVRGVNSAVQAAIRGRQIFDGAIRNNFVRTSTVIGNSIDINGCRRLFLEQNHAPSGTIVVNDGGASTAYGSILNNECSTLTTTLTSGDNWTVSSNDTASANTCLVGQSRGSFTGSLTGCTTVPTASIKYVIQGRQVTLQIPTLTGTSNTTAATITGMPALLRPLSAQNCWGNTLDNGLSRLGNYGIASSGVMTLNWGQDFAAFTAAGLKGTSICTITYALD